jgi:hypothetical protein
MYKTLHMLMYKRFLFVGIETIFYYVMIKGMNKHLVVATIRKWYVMHIFLKVILFPQTNNLKLLLSFKEKKV